MREQTGRSQDPQRRHSASPEGAATPPLTAPSAKIDAGTEWSAELQNPKSSVLPASTRLLELVAHSVEGAALTFRTGYLLLGETLGTWGRAVSLMTSAAKGSQNLIYGFLGAGLVNSLQQGHSNSLIFVGFAAGFAAVKFIVGSCEAYDQKQQTRAAVESGDLGYRMMRNALLTKDYESMRVANISNAVSQASENLWRFPLYMVATTEVVAQTVSLGIAGYAICKAPIPVICCALSAATLSIVKNVHLARKAAEDEPKITDPRRRTWWLGWMTVDPASTKEVRMLGVAPELEGKRQESRSVSIDPLFKRSQVEFLYNLADNPVSALAMAGSIYMLGTSVKGGSLDLGTASFIALTAYPTFVQTLGQLSTTLGKLLEHGPHIKHYQTIATLEPGIISRQLDAQANKTSSVIDRIPPSKSIEFVHAAYSYPDSSGSREGAAAVFKNVNISLPAGSMVMICGENGVGKSTLFECLVGLRTPTEGALLINGQLPDSAQKGEWAKMLGICFQDFYLFGSLTFREILTIGAPPVSEEYFNRVLKETGVRRILDEKIQEGDRIRPRFPKGIDSTFGSTFKDGVDLSGGGKQKFAIARALLRRPAVIVLDEFTSALDPVLVNEVLSIVRDLKQDGMTMVLATHEMGFATQVADEVCFLESGNILERGSAEQVIKNPANPKTQEFLKRVHQAGRL